MAGSKPAPLLAEIFTEIAPKIGASILVEPHWKIAGQITFGSGRRRYFRFSSIDLNSLGASEIAKDKAFANFFMLSMGYETITGDTFFSPAWAEILGVEKGIPQAQAYADTIGYPVIVKPNSGSQGKHVSIAMNHAELAQALEAVFTADRVALVQRRVTGRDYRIVVLDDQVISAYQRIPLSVEGDGRRTITELMDLKQAQFQQDGRDTVLKRDDPRIDHKLARNGLTRSSIPQSGEKIFLLDNANLSAGGEAVDITDELHPSIAHLAVRLTKDMGLRLCGVDLLIPGDPTKRLSDYTIIEVNAAPGLDHYARVGAEQRAIVEAMYLRVLQSMDRD